MDVLRAIELLSPDDLGQLAARLGTEPDVNAVKHRCETCHRAAEIVNDMLFSPTRSSTPPPRAPPCTPPPVARKWRAQY